MRVSDVPVGAASPAIEGIGSGFASCIGIFRASVSSAGFGGVISGGMAACGVWVVSGAGLSEQGASDTELIFPWMG